MTDTTVLETAVLFLGTSQLATLGILASRVLSRPALRAVTITHHQTRPGRVPESVADGTADHAPVPSATPDAITSHVDPVTRQFVRKDGSNKALDRIRAEATAS